MAEGPDLWSHKPWWCQPWSIVATGVTLVGGSWWWLFLVLVPAAYAAEGDQNRNL